jgi:CheY-like chemotaxis protein
LGEYLCRHGHEVTAASNGRDGLAAAAAKVPELVLCDLSMPGLDGHEVLAAFRQDERLAEVPFIFLSGCTEHEQVRRSMNLGGDDYLTKPARLAEILEAVNAKLAQRQAQRQRQEKRLKKALEVFVGIVHDLDHAPSHVRWLADTTTGKDGRQIPVAPLLQAPAGAKPAAGGGAVSAAGAPASLLIKSNNRQQFLKISEVKALLADSEYSTIHWGRNQRMMFRKAMKQWEEELPSNQFVRVHRRAIVNLAFLDFVDNDAAGNLQIHLREFNEVIPVSQRARAAFQRSLKAWRS